MSDLISRQAAIDALLKLTEARETWRSTEAARKEISGIDVSMCAILDLPSAQPEQRWIPITSRPMTEDERALFESRFDYEITDHMAVMFDCQLPDNGQKVLVYHKWSGEVAIDTFCEDNEGCYFEENGEMDGITHWMPLPEPPKEK